MKTIYNTLLFSLLATSSIVSANANLQSKDLRIFTSIEVTKPELEPVQNGFSFKQNYSPKLTLGLAKEFQLDENWQLVSSVSISYLNTNIERFSFDDGTKSASYDELGLWGAVKLKRNNLYPNISPFIELGAGLIEADYHLNQTIKKETVAGLKATTGVEFTLTKGSTISVGLGFSNFDDFNIAN